MRRALWVVLLTACDPGAVEPSSTVQQEILGGSADAGFGLREVFLIGMTFTPDAGGSICSAALIGSRTLLTAAHCIDPARRAGATGVTIIAVNKPTDVGLTAADIHRMTEYRLHPMWNPTVESADFDIALLLLDKVPDAGPRPIARTAPATGQAITLAGYGRDDPMNPGSSGTRRAAAANITSVSAQSFGFGTSGSLGICGGDSGGPALRLFPDGITRIVGIHSTTPDLAVCGDGSDTRVDFHAGFIDTFLAQKDPPPFVDAGTPDAGTPPADAGTPQDAGTAQDAGTTADAGTMNPMDAPGCGCSAGGAPFALLLLAVLRRRKHALPLPL